MQDYDWQTNDGYIQTNLGFARRLLAFFVTELSKEHTAVKPWVNEDQLGTIALYHSIGFQAIGSCYTGYFRN